LSETTGFSALFLDFLDFLDFFRVTGSSAVLEVAKLTSLADLRAPGTGVE